MIQKQSGADLDPELIRMYKLLNQECHVSNQEKRRKIVERSAKKGLRIQEKDVNLLMVDDPSHRRGEEESTSSISDSNNSSNNEE